MSLGEPGLCKVCGAACHSLGAVDFNRTCLDGDGPRFEASGEFVAYVRCERCGLVFTRFFDDWSPEDFGRRIYNADYSRADPEFDGVRARRCAQGVVATLGRNAAQIRALDYGGGAGLWAETLRAAGFASATTYDPFSPPFDRRPSETFNLVNAVEVLEHSTTPRDTVGDIAAFLAQDGLILFSTLLAPPGVGVDWWYVGPRNGHVTFYTQHALARLFGPLGLQVRSFDANWHVAFREPPAFAEPLLNRLPRP